MPRPELLRPGHLFLHRLSACRAKDRDGESARLGVADSDPLLDLLQRYLAERKAFDEADANGGIPDQDWDRIARNGWSRTQDKIIQSEPPATTAAGALLALDHVLQSDDLFADRSESADLQLLWLLIKAAHDYIVAVETRAG